MARVRRFLNPVCGLLLAACASSGSSKGASAALLVTLHDFKTGKRFELASESHTHHVDYYSGARTDATRKVVSDEKMSAFVDELERQGLGDHAQSGHAPSVASGGVISWGLEVERGSDSSHWLIGKGSPQADWQQFQRCRDMFLELYNNTVSYQTLKNENGKQFFEDGQHAGPNEKKKK